MQLCILGVGIWLAAVHVYFGTKGDLGDDLEFGGEGHVIRPGAIG
jgi:hypothetical protein